MSSIIAIFSSTMFPRQDESLPHTPRTDFWRASIGCAKQLQIHGRRDVMLGKRKRPDMAFYVTTAFNVAKQDLSTGTAVACGLVMVERNAIVVAQNI